MPTDPGPICVLLVDDHPVVRAGLRSVLDSAPGITVAAEADSGEAAVEELAAGGPFGLVIMDVQMPGMGGIAATAQITAASGPPVLILTTFETDALVVDALAAGATGYILKDAPTEDLRSAVRRAATGRTALSGSAAARLAKRAGRPRTALTARELEILRAVATGASNGDIAAALFISQATVKTHLVHIFDKLGVATRTQAVTHARAEGIID